MGERQFLGVVEVDSGTLLVGDPLYVLPDQSRGRTGLDYATVLRPGDAPAAPLGNMPVLLLGHFGGDGSFPVFGEFDADGILVRACIEFVEPDE